MRAATTLCLVLAALLVPAPGAANGIEPDVETGYVRELNRVRAAQGLAPLRIDPALTSAARSHSLDMLQRRSFEHGDVRSRLTRFGVRAGVMGENLAWGVAEVAGARSIVALWLSSRHRRNVLHPSFTRVGIGVVTGTFSGYGGVRMITADFASPASD